ncbi:hypothetical protein jhhlp_008609 [Lomentospora prolificans]|uniref:Altered inheritance of mitochondria protein 6 n=1 Tax=Lomentospora prolificans TaxID=41688 RepID=A0A2N3MYI1_9PEZI|nr:hypothetical protein jhhlp_008609 [Lomentospora prolificans]
MERHQGTLSQRSSFESTIYDDSYAQTSDIESGRPLLRETRPVSDEQANEKTKVCEGDDDALVIYGCRVGRGTVLCGAILTFVIIILSIVGIPTFLARLIYAESPYVEKPNPISCHSHNDYWRKEPVFSALKTGCVGIEADVWLVEDDLWIAHEWSDLKRGVNFTGLYVDPLVKLLEQRNSYFPGQGWTHNGVYESDPDQTLALVIDLKSESHDTWPVVQAQLQPLRERDWLTHVSDGKVHYRPITVVGSGNTDFATLRANSTFHDSFFDAPLNALEGSEYDATNSYYASVSFTEHLGLSLTGHLTQRQVERLRKSVREAHSRGLKARYWGAPAWALGVRDRVWKVLSDEGVDIVNVDDLQSFRDWTTARAELLDTL